VDRQLNRHRSASIISTYAAGKLCWFFRVLFLLAITGYFSDACKAQTSTDYDEVSITLNVQRIGVVEVPALIRNETVYLSIVDIFEFLHIKNAVSVKMDSISGSFIDPQSKFIIDKQHNRIVYMNKVYDLQPGDLIGTTTTLYLKSDYFGKVFGLNCMFSFRNLSVVLSTELELPVIREMRQDQMRANVNKLKGVVKADTTIGRSYPFFHFGTADYFIVNSAYTGGAPQDTRIGLGLGGIVAGGETNVVLNYDNHEPFSERQQFYFWRYVNNNSPVMKQISAGKIYGQSISSIYAPLVGVNFTNTPTTYRRSFGTYTLSNHTEPNWIVELYVNGVLITYVKADASGFYTFNVPLVYGNSVVKLRFYGPYGELRSSEQNISIPFNFLPEHEFEYTATAGIVEDGYKTRFSRFTSNYGLSKSITIGGGTEYLSSITSGKTIPFINTSIRLLPNLFVSGEYDHNVRMKTVLNYNLPSGLQLEVNNSWYKKGQTAINNTFLEDRRAVLSFPIRGSTFSVYSRLTLEQIILPSIKYTTAQWLISSVFGNYSTSINTYSLFIENNKPYVYSDLSVSTRIFRSILFTQELQYEYVEKKVVGTKSSMERRLFKNGYVNVSYERNFSSNITNTEIGLRYNFSFAQTRTAIRSNNRSLNFLQSINGSLVHDTRSRLNDFSDHSRVGTGAVILIPYLDLNGNGKRDADEPKAPGLKANINGGRIKPNIKDTTIQITDLESYTNYNIELDPAGFDRVAWQLPKKNYAVIIDPNFVKRIEVPVLVSGEASGRIIFKNKGNEKGQGRMLICFYNDRLGLIARTVSEIDGYFTYLGLLPGAYTAQIDTAQLSKLHMVSLSGSLKFTIARNSEGAVADGLMFEVKPDEKYVTPKDSLDENKGAAVQLPDTSRLAAKQSSLIKDPPIRQQTVTIIARPGKSLANKAAYLKLKSFAYSQLKLNKYDYKIKLIKTKQPYFEIRIMGILNREEINIIINKLKSIGFTATYHIKKSG
jgi:hypothetical protein